MTTLFSAKTFSTATIIAMAIATSACNLTTDHLKTHGPERAGTAHLPADVKADDAASQGIDVASNQGPKIVGTVTWSDNLGRSGRTFVYDDYTTKHVYDQN